MSQSKIVPIAFNLQLTNKDHHLNKKMANGAKFSIVNI